MKINPVHVLVGLVVSALVLACSAACRARPAAAVLAWMGLDAAAILGARFEPPKVLQMRKAKCCP